MNNGSSRSCPTRRDLNLTTAYLIITVATGITIVALSVLAVVRNATASPLLAVGSAVFALSLTALAYGNFAYLLAR